MTGKMAIVGDGDSPMVFQAGAGWRGAWVRHAGRGRRETGSNADGKKVEWLLMPYV